VTTETMPAKVRKPRLPSTTPAALGLGEKPAKAKPGDPPGTHVRAKVDELIRELLAREPGTRAGVDPEELHQMRVALRRLRSLLKTSVALLGPAADTVRADLGLLGRALGEVRDYDVLIGHLRELVTGFEARDQLAARELIAKFVARRAVAKRRLTKALSSANYATTLQSAAQLARLPEHEPEVADPGAKAPAPVDLVAGLRKPYRKLAKAVTALPADPPDDDLHALRIGGKRLRYAAELAVSSVKKKEARKVRRLVAATKDLQTVLGDHQDAVIAADRMRALLDELDGRTGFIAGRIAELELAKRARCRARWLAVWADVDTASRAVTA
jgi:CHAD domain-containing protein